MKKLMFVMAAVAAGIAVADVTSANIVGYTTATISSKYQIFGVNFQAVDGTSLKINDLIPYQEGMTKGDSISTADQIQVGTETGGWSIYFLSNGKNKKGSTVAGLDGKWSENGKYAVTDATLEPGQAFWYVRKDESLPTFNLTIAGSVTTFPSASYEFASKYRIFANPFTVALPLNGGSFPYDSMTMTAGDSISTADQIQIGTATGGWSIYFLSNGKNKKGSTVAGLEGKWSENGKYAVSDAAIPVGKAAWYVRKDTAKPAPTFTFTKPYDL